MNEQEGMNSRRIFRMAAIAAAVVAVLGLAAYLFGSGLRADVPASLVALQKSRSDFYAGLNNSASQAALAKSRADFYAEQNNSAAAVRAASLAALAKSRSDFYADLNNSAATGRAASLAALAKSRADFYADLNNSAAAADPYRYSWMGFTSPESVGAKLSVTSDSAAHPATSIKTEGINPAAAASSAAKEFPWMKPEGITVSGAK